MSNIWPDQFDFNTDPVCQTVFKPFIEEEIQNLAAYDQMRPEDITYIFHEHAQRVAENTYRICIALGLGEIVANNMRWAVLPHDIGKRLLPIDVWDKEEKPSEQEKQYRRMHTLLGAHIVIETFPDIRHPFKDLMIDIMSYHHEQMDGHGTHKIKGEDLSAPVRLTAIVEAYDGYRIWRPHFKDRDISVPSVLERMRNEKGDQIYDMAFFETFARVKMDDYQHGRVLQVRQNK